MAAAKTKLVIDSLADMSILNKETASSILYIPTKEEHKRVMKEGLYANYDFVMFAPALEKEIFFDDIDKDVKPFRI